MGFDYLDQLPYDALEIEHELHISRIYFILFTLFRYEARHLPSIVTSTLDPRHFDDRQTTGYAHIDAREADQPECLPELRPSEAWLQRFLKAFLGLRQRLQR